MSKIAKYLQQHLEGEVTDSPEALQYFATDASILKLQPACLVFPRNEDDVRKLLRFAWGLAERGHKVPVTARGGGTDESGAAIGGGILAIFNSHLERILYLNPRKKVVTAEVGLKLARLQQTLYTHGLFLPVLADSGRASVGGAIAGNLASSTPAGSGSNLADSLRVVLANGEIIEARALNKKELSLKLGLSNLEGQIYRELDALLEETEDIVKTQAEKLPGLNANSAGYNLAGIKSGGMFNLVPLLAGSQGTLGVITSAELNLQEHTPPAYTAFVSLGRLSSLEALWPNLLKLQPLVCDFVNDGLIEQVLKVAPAYFDDELARPRAVIHLLVEFGGREANQKKAIEALRRLSKTVGAEIQVTHEPAEQDRLRRVIESPRLLTLDSGSRNAPLPLMTLAIPAGTLPELIKKLYQAYKLAELPPTIRGQAGAGVVRVEAALDLSQLGDRQKLFKLSEAAAKAATSLGGTFAASGGEGRLHVDKVENFYGKDLYEVMREVKRIFDPHGILNPGVKFEVGNQDVKTLLNSTYAPRHKYES